MRKDFRDYFNKKYREENRVLQIGDIVTRSLKKGDIGLFNRAPSLHRQSAGDESRAFTSKVISV